MKYIGIDLGGTNVRAGLVEKGYLTAIQESGIKSGGSEEEIIGQIFNVIDRLKCDSPAGIGMGVPSVVDVDRGIVYDVVNIPSWKEVHVKEIFEKRYNMPVHVNNDANCFAMAEYHFGKGKGTKSMIGLIMGTGMAGGIIINGKPYEGANCGAGEFGMIQYLDHYLEYYSSGQFFSNIHNTTGVEVAGKALAGNPPAIAMMEEFGGHVGKAITAILYAYDPQKIILGGSVSKSYSLFKDAMWKELENFAFRPVIKNLVIEVSTLQHPGVLGAAALCI